MFHPSLSRLGLAIAAAVAVASTSLVGGAYAPARAQTEVSVSAEFRTALEPHGKWQRHNRWGEVWIPAKRERGWRPYTVGQWVYTDDYGWYWTAADAEADWGWIVYHYGRWVMDDDLGWVWVPGNEWGPGWVNWRRGKEHFGWAPLPPDQVVVEYRDKPDAWIFVRSRDFVAPVMARVIVPVADYRVIIQRTVVVNRTVVIRDRRIAVNPGIAPGIIAARVGRPIRAFNVRPVVLAGTARLQGAVEIRAGELRGRDRIRVTVSETKTTIQPVKNVPKPRPLAANEQGRLGDNPPRAARRDAREERQEDRRDAREERQEDRRDAREERRDDRRDAREDRRDQKQDDRRDAREERQDRRQDAQEQQKRDQRQDRRQDAQEQKRDQRQDRRQDAQEQKRDQRQDRRQDAQEQKRDQQRQERQGAQEQRQRQGAQEQKQRQGAGAGQTEGRSPPTRREPDRAQPSGRDNAPQRPEPRAKQQGEQPDRGGAGGGAERRGNRN
jgi:hypothetical protein